MIILMALQSITEWNRKTNCNCHLISSFLTYRAATKSQVGVISWAQFKSKMLGQKVDSRLSNPHVVALQKGLIQMNTSRGLLTEISKLWKYFVYITYYNVHFLFSIDIVKINIIIIKANKFIHHIDFFSWMTHEVVGCFAYITLYLAK